MFCEFQILQMHRLFISSCFWC